MSEPVGVVAAIAHPNQSRMPRLASSVRADRRILNLNKISKTRALNPIQEALLHTQLPSIISKSRSGAYCCPPWLSESPKSPCVTDLGRDIFIVEIIESQMYQFFRLNAINFSDILSTQNFLLSNIFGKYRNFQTSHRLSKRGPCVLLLTSFVQCLSFNLFLFRQRCLRSDKEKSLGFLFPSNCCLLVINFTLSKKEGLCRQAKRLNRSILVVGKCRAWCRANEMMLFEISWLSDVISKTRPTSWLVIFLMGSRSPSQRLYHK